MKMVTIKILPVFTMLILLFGMTGLSTAAVTAGQDIIPAPDFIVDDPPGAVNDHQQAFDERQCVFLTSDLPVDGGPIPAGTIVSSHMIFLNTKGTTSASDQNVSWNFDGSILGVMSATGGTLEAASSPFLGDPTTIYSAAFPNRGMESNDSYLVAGDTITVNMSVAEPGDWIRVVTDAQVPCDNVKWRQPPDMKYGVNIQSTVNPSVTEPWVADDWQCRDPRPVTDVHFWGSFIGWESDNPDPTAPHPPIEAFMIRIYHDVPAGSGPDPNPPYSHPGKLLYEAKIDNFDEFFEASIKLPDDTFEHKFYYSLDLPDPFNQTVGTIYWISIVAVMPEMPNDNFFPWGWETSIRHWNDNAARYWVHNMYWEEITPLLMPPWYREIYPTVDMAFELTVAPELPPPPPLEAVKWQQRPDRVNGINIRSNPLEDPSGNRPQTVADDWLCLDGSPVSDLHFWGSYLTWFELDPFPGGPIPGVERFRIQVYSDAPASVGGVPYSRPDKLLYETWVGKFNETYVDSLAVNWPPGAEFEHKFRYDLDLPRIFWQKRDRIYWLNISAIPKDPQFPWGWESSMDRWNDYAVFGWYNTPDDRAWRPIDDPRRMDMSFELTTCGGPIKWLQFPDMADGINIVSLPEQVVADDWLCTNGRPVTEVHFWGSYLTRDGEVHWQQQNPGPPVSPLPQPPPVVQGFKFSFHSDIPAGADPEVPWSHPGELLHEVGVAFDLVRYHYWDSVPHTAPTGEVWWEHKFRYIVRLEKPFKQEKGLIYWLDIAGIPVADSDFVWGWETSKDHWNDNAVRRQGQSWLPIGQLQEKKVDMAFALITPDDEDYCEGDFDRDGDVDEKDLEVFASDFGRNNCYDTGDCEGDFDYDGDQDGLDLLKFKEDYDRDDCPCPLPEPKPCDDENPCTIDFVDPTTGECRFEPKDCDDRNPCTEDFCDPDTGQCRHINICEACCLPDGTCREIPPVECQEQEGRPQGPDKRCADVECPQPVATLGDFVWMDLDNNGIQDTGEPGLPGVAVELMDCSGNILAMTTTAGNGFYAFTVQPGNYNLKFSLPPDLVFSPQDQGTDDALDSDADPNSGMTVCTTLDPGETDRTWDAGMFRPEIQACCWPNGQCSDTPPAGCRSEGGRPLGPGTSCNSVQCPQPQACIIPDGSCLDLPVTLCLEGGGDPQGPGTSCN
jgi:hypothetical protein